MKAIKTILHPTDFSEHSFWALRIAASIAQAQDSELHILHVVPKAAPVTGAGKVAELERAERYQQELKSYREEMEARLHHLKVPQDAIRVNYLFKEGDVAKVILSTAEETASDLIVMGSHGKSGYLRAILGSAAEEVCRDAPCPVLTVRLPKGHKMPA